MAISDLDPCGVLLYELFLEEPLSLLDVLRRHVQPALLGDVVLVQVRRTHPQPLDQHTEQGSDQLLDYKPVRVIAVRHLDVRRREARAVVRHVL